VNHHYLVACATTVLLLATGAGTAQAVTLPQHRSPRMDDFLRARQQRWETHARGAGQAGTGASVLNGHVYDYSGAAAAANVTAWGDLHTDSFEKATGTTDAAGAYSLSGFGADGGELWILPFAGDATFARTNLTWSNPGPTTFDFRPGKTDVTLYRGGPWHSDADPASNWHEAVVEVHEQYGGAFGSTAIFDDGTSSPVSGQAQSLPGHQSTAAVYYHMDEVAEVPVSIDTVAGTVAGSLSADQANAMRMTICRPALASGKPGTGVRVALSGFPVGWTGDFRGYPDYPATAPINRRGGPFGSSSTGVQYAGAGIPFNATPGYWYIVALSDGLFLETPFQVCTLKSSRATITRGGSVRLHGIVPTEGHWGGKAGKRKRLVLYKRTAKAAQPTSATSPHGWTRVTSFRCNGYGKYTSALLRPKRSTWYVVRYPGDNWYWTAYTSVIKVGVR